MNFYELSRIVENEHHTPNAAYTAVVLDDSSRGVLLKVIGPLMEQAEQDFSGWETIAHHMTINMGSLDPNLNEPTILGKDAKLTATHFGYNHLVAAAAVNTDVNSRNKIKHVTIAVNRAGGGKTFHSNQIAKWMPLREHITMIGVVTEVPH